MYNFNELKLSKLCTDIDNHGTMVVVDQINADLFSNYWDLKPLIYSFYSLYQYCQKYYIDIDNVFKDIELQTFFNLIKTLDKMNLELAKQLLIIKIRECIALNQKRSLVKKTY